MFYSPKSSIFRIFYEINEFKKFKMAAPSDDGGYFNVKSFIVTLLLLLMASNLFSGTIILSEMLLLRLCGYTSNSEGILIK